ncbi:hypothetical protein [Massilia sp. METH4]|uniref:hypothetical protein n=1 Tax=Massilia sp. METH4 TaxID=3123041 RepID=UPI0030CAD5CB
MKQQQLTAVERDEVYSTLSQRVTSVGTAQESLYLARLVLLMAEAIADKTHILRLLEEAGEGMERVPCDGPKTGSF